VVVLKAGKRLETYQPHPRLLKSFHLGHLLLRERDLLIAQRKVCSNLVRKKRVSRIVANKLSLLLEETICFFLDRLAVRFLRLVD
jgi:hypothetical protein